METKFDATKTLSETDPKVILDWAISIIQEEVAKSQMANAERIAKIPDENIRRMLGKRDTARLEKGKTTIAEIRDTMLDRENTDDAYHAMKAIDNLKVAFGKELPREIRVEVNWKKSRTWGSNPTAEVWADGYTSYGPVGGCGYDKESTATAHAFNDNPVFARIVATCAWLDMKESEATGRHGTTYGYLVDCAGFRFEVSVGYSCHRNIIERAGYRTVAEFHPKMADGYTYEKNI